MTPPSKTAASAASPAAITTACSISGTCPQLLTEEMKAREVPVPIPAGGCLLFHSLNLHYSSPNTSANRRRAWALHYMMAKTRDLSTDEEVHVDYISVRGKSHAGFV